MRTIVLATQKGGSGKSTLTVGLAGAAIEAGRRVAIIDTDRQATVASWGGRRALAQPRIERAASGDDIERALPVLRRAGFALVLIDTPATHNDLSVSAIAAAEMCLIPTRPSPADIEASLPTLRAIRELGKPFAFVLNQTQPRGYRRSEAAEALNTAGVLALPYIVQRNDHQDALAAGFAVTEFAPDGKAAEEIRGLWRWVWNRLDADSINHGQAPIRATA